MSATTLVFLWMVWHPDSCQLSAWLWREKRRKVKGENLFQNQSLLLLWDVTSLW